MRRRVPTPPRLQQHATGVWFTTWGKRWYYFTKDAAESKVQYLQHIQLVWTPMQTAAIEAIPKHTITVAELAELYLASVEVDSSRDLMVDYRSNLRHFLAAWGKLPAERVCLQILEALKKDMVNSGKYKPRSINHALKTIRRMMKWGADHDYAPRIELSGLKMIKVPRPTPASPPASAIHDLLNAARANDPRLVPWLAINYLGLLRPSELVRLAHGQGAWVQRGIFAMQSKTQGQDGEQNYRHVVLSEEVCADWLTLLRPFWKTWESYSDAVEAACGYGGPRRLRAWGATHLRLAGASRGDIDVVLGHAPPGTLHHYMAEDWEQLRTLAGRLSLRQGGSEKPLAARYASEVEKRKAEKGGKPRVQDVPRKLPDPPAPPPPKRKRKAKAGKDSGAKGS